MIWRYWTRRSEAKPFFYIYLISRKKKLIEVYFIFFND